MFENPEDTYVLGHSLDNPKSSQKYLMVVTPPGRQVIHYHKRYEETREVNLNLPYMLWTISVRSFNASNIMVSLYSLNYLEEHPSNMVQRLYGPLVPNCYRNSGSVCMSHVPWPNMHRAEATVQSITNEMITTFLHSNFNDDLGAGTNRKPTFPDYRRLSFSIVTWMKQFGVEPIELTPLLDDQFAIPNVVASVEKISPPSSISIPAAAADTFVTTTLTTTNVTYR